jgi:hypothetical protein
MFRLSSILALLLSGAFITAQTPDAARIRGQVLDQTHAAVPGAEVKITNNRVGAERSTRTDSSGHFFFSGLQIGTYSLTVHKDKFAELRHVVRADVVIVDDQRRFQR